MPPRQRKRQGNANDGGGLEPTEQLKEYCFNIYGHAFLHDIKDRKEKQRIVTYPLSSKPYTARLAELKGKCRNPQLALTEEERREANPPHTIQCMLVGLIPPDMDGRDVGKPYADDVSASKKGRAIGIYKPSKALQSHNNLFPLRVVAGITNTEPAGGIKLYALINPKNGLCTPHIVAQKEVFYFSEFRDLTKATEARKKAWNELVKAQSIVAIDDRKLSDKQVKYKRAREATKLICEPRRSFANEVALLTATFSIHREEWILNQLEKVLELTNEDLDDNQFPKNSTIKAFIEKTGEWDMAIAVKLIDEIKILWPEVANTATPQDILDLQEGLRTANITLEYRSVRGFLALGIAETQRLRSKKEKEERWAQKLSKKEREKFKSQKSKSSEKETQALGKLVITVRDRVILIIGTDLPRASFDNGAAAVLIPALTQKLKAISAAYKKSSNAIRDLAGDQVVATSLHDLFETFKNAADTDTAKMAFFQAVRYGLMAISTQSDTTSRPLDDIIEILEHLAIQKA